MISPKGDHGGQRFESPGRDTGSVAIERFRVFASVLLVALLSSLLLSFLLAPLLAPRAVAEISLTEEAAQRIGAKIFHNECASQRQCLVSWNQGERFPSLGIGHFIWYPQDVDEGYHESFPDLVRYMRVHGYSLPPWLATLTPFDAPWHTRDEFVVQQSEDTVEALRTFLLATRGVQLQFMLSRARQSLADIVEATPPDERPAMRGVIHRLLALPAGIYAVVDYVNFKGEGLLVSERLEGKGWGLKQVLSAVAPDAPDILQAFRQAAVQVLSQRAALSHNPQMARQWLPAWKRRIQTYR